MVARLGLGVTVPSTGCPYFLFVIKKQKPPKRPRMSLQHFWHAQAQKVLHIPGSCLLTEDLQPDLLKKNRLGGGKSDQMNSANLLEGLGENMNEESKQQASPDTVLQSQVHFQVQCEANTTIPKSASRRFPSACPHPETQPSSKPSYRYRSNPFCLKQMFSLPFSFEKFQAPHQRGVPRQGWVSAPSAWRRGESSSRAKCRSRLPPGYRVLL